MTTPFLFRCPRTQMWVQALDEREPPGDAEKRTGRDFVSMECPSCGGAHMVEPGTGKVLGHDDG